MNWMFLPLKRYAEFSGRSQRIEYWMYTLGIVILYSLFIISVIAIVGGSFLGAGSTSIALPTEGSSPDIPGSSVGGVIAVFISFVIVILALFIPSLALSVRRLHDIGYSGHWVWIFWGPNLASSVIQFISPTMGTILAVVSILGWIALQIMAMIDGTKGANHFGPDPKGGDHAEIFA